MPHKNELENTSVIALANKSNIIMQALHEVESHYKQAALAYEEELRHYAFEIEQCQLQINTLVKTNRTKELKLLEIQAELHYEEKLLERLNTQFAQEIKSLSELKNEYKAIISAEEYARLSSAKESSIGGILDEIEDVETVLLAKELEHLNILAVVEPIRKEIEALERRKRALVAQKEYFTSTQLHKISQLSLHLDDAKEEEIVEADVVESAKT